VSERVEVILVDEGDRDVGRCEKLEAHRRGLLHRAVSVFAFDAEGRLLVQQRDPAKYHTGGLWSNTACTHPREGEALADAVARATQEELGVGVTSLAYAFPFTYRADVGGGLVEHEYDHVFTATVEGTPRPVAGEVSAVAWHSLADLEAAVARNPGAFTPWFRLLLPRVAAFDRR
jgi:isopentenyl-diphosphate delta-isomerase